MKNILLLIITALSFSVAYGQTFPFQKTYGGTIADGGRDILQTADGSFIITGETYSFGSGYSDVYLIKTSADGTLQWAKTFGDTLSETGHSVRQTMDEGFIITGNVYNAGGNFDVYLIKTDNNGTTQWSRTFGGNNDDYGYSVQQTTDRGFIIAGNTKSFGAGNDDVYLIKTDSSGTLEWTRTFGGIQSDISSSVEQTSDGGYIISGGTMSFGAGGQDVYLVKTDSTGTLQWTRTFGGAMNDGSLSVKKTNNGGYIIAGSANSFGVGGEDVYLIKTDSNGILTWTKTYGGSNQDIGYSVALTDDGGYIVSGITRSFNAFPYTDSYMVKVDSTGTVQWSKIFGGTNNDESYSIVQTNAGGFIFTGSTNSFGNNHMYLVMTDSAGNSGCHDSIPNTLSGTGGIQGTGGVEGSGGASNTPFTQSGSGGTEIILCSPVKINEIAKRDLITIFPNPFTIDAILYSDKHLINATLTVDNYFGQTLKQIKNISGQTVTLSRDNLPGGLYFLRLTHEDKLIATGKIIIIN